MCNKIDTRNCLCHVCVCAIFAFFSHFNYDWHCVFSVAWIALDRICSARHTLIQSKQFDYARRILWPTNTALHCLFLNIYGHFWLVLNYERAVYFVFSLKINSVAKDDSLGKSSGNWFFLLLEKTMNISLSWYIFIALFSF